MHASHVPCTWFWPQHKLCWSCQRQVDLSCILCSFTTVSAAGTTYTHDLYILFEKKKELGHKQSWLQNHSQGIVLSWILPYVTHGIIHLYCVHTFLFCDTAANIEYIYQSSTYIPYVPILFSEILPYQANSDRHTSSNLQKRGFRSMIFVCHPCTLVTPSGITYI